jgi:membrane protein required for colicin V production
VDWVDLLIVGVIAWITFRAFSNGLIREAITLIALLLGIVLAGAFYRQLSADIAFLIENERARNLVAFLALLGGMVILGQLLSIILQRAASLLMLGPLDHIGGAAFGFVKALLLVQVLLFVVAVYPPAHGVAAAVDDSKLAPLFLRDVPGVDLALPGEFQNALDQLRQFRSMNSAIAPGLAPAR